MSNEQSWVEKFAKETYEFIGKYAIPFTTPFFAIYNCYKLMNAVKDKNLKIVIFTISMIYVLMSLGLAIYLVFKKE